MTTAVLTQQTSSVYHRILRLALPGPGHERTGQATGPASVSQYSRSGRSGAPTE
jgi:hypothetical protein